MTLRRTLLRSLVSVVAGLPACAATTPEVDAQEKCAFSQRDVIHATALDSLHVLERGGIASVRSGWIVAGIERPAGMSDPPKDGDRTPRVVHQVYGRIPPPERPSSSVPMEIPIPAALTADRWGVIWAEAEPIGDQPDWPANMFTSLRFSEYLPEGWSPGIEILDAAWIYWQSTRTTKYVPGRGTFVMVSATDRRGQPILAFGSVQAPLQALPFDADLFPRIGSFGMDSTGSTRAVAELVGPDKKSRLVILYSEDSGDSWSEPEVIAAIDSPIKALRVLRDRDGVTHVLWQESAKASLQHVSRAAGARGWKLHPTGHPPELLITWISGRDRCGRLTLVTWTPVPEGPLDLAIARWGHDGWSEFSDLLPGYVGLAPFDGWGHDGTWWIGVSGQREGEGLSTMGVFLAEP